MNAAVRKIFLSMFFTLLGKSFSTLASSLVQIKAAQAMMELAEAALNAHDADLKLTFEQRLRLAITGVLGAAITLQENCS